ncbi:MAG TPA: cyclic nucleotide-binding domain-containing protein, partial [Solirubrobacteraceae bacterium]|nr:cyclic nucleotide-binding domain-containing protein [Solirubrobacteraceae bacterium]
MSEPAGQDFLASVPLFAGRTAAELDELVALMRPRTVQPGRTLWHQGDEPRELILIVDGTVSASVRVTGGREVEIGTSGRGEIVGLIGVLDGAGHATTVRAVDATTVLALGSLDFAALLAGMTPSAFRLRRHLARLLVARLGSQIEHLAASLGGGAPGPVARPDAEPLAPELDPAPAADSRYVRRMASFHDFDPLALWGFLTSGRYVHCPPGRTLLEEGAPSPAYYLTINGAVEKVLVRGDRRIRVGLAGPGKAFGYEGLIDGRASQVTAIARERALLLVVPRELFGRLFAGEDAVSRGFLAVIQNDLMAT